MGAETRKIAFQLAANLSPAPASERDRERHVAIGLKRRLVRGSECLLSGCCIVRLKNEMAGESSGVSVKTDLRSQPNSGATGGDLLDFPGQLLVVTLLTPKSFHGGMTILGGERRNELHRLAARMAAGPRRAVVRHG